MKRLAILLLALAGCGHGRALSDDSARIDAITRISPHDDDALAFEGTPAPHTAPSTAEPLSNRPTSWGWTNPAKTKSRAAARRKN